MTTQAETRWGCMTCKVYMTEQEAKAHQQAERLHFVVRQEAVYVAAERKKVTCGWGCSWDSAGVFHLAQGCTAHTPEAEG